MCGNHWCAGSIENLPKLMSTQGPHEYWGPGTTEGREDTTLINVGKINVILPYQHDWLFQLLYEQQQTGSDCNLDTIRNTKHKYLFLLI